MREVTCSVSTQQIPSHALRDGHRVTSGATDGCTENDSTAEVGSEMRLNPHRVARNRDLGIRRTPGLLGVRRRCRSSPGPAGGVRRWAPSNYPKILHHLKAARRVRASPTRYGWARCPGRMHEGRHGPGDPL